MVLLRLVFKQTWLLQLASKISKVAHVTQTPEKFGCWSELLLVLINCAAFQ